ncbi:MAG: phytanoyl-CoA dioxygenase family protein [Deltaproteobacteria bacterium]|nr:phytanoyl-CoA dioxygenase family protein [Deltaproteobacteria bacterium]
MRIVDRLKRARPVSLGLTALDVGLRRALYADRGRRPVVSPAARDVVRALRRDGVVFLPGYWSRDRCERARAAVDRLMAAHPERVWQDPVDADHRLYGLERVDPDARAFLDDPLLAEVAAVYLRARLEPRMVSAGRLDAAPGNIGSGAQSWHRDGVTQPLKGILYLSDVGPEDGPMEYVKGTVRLRDQLRHIARSGAVFRQLNWDDAGVARLERTAPGSVVTCTAAAGTLVLANTFGVHRGRPATRGPRYALTSYYFAPRTLPMVAAYYDRQLVQVDGGTLGEALRGTERAPH